MNYSTRIIVAGTRTFNDYDLLKLKLDKFTKGLKKIVIVSGAAKGADTLGERYGHSYKYPVMRYHPDYEKHGKAAPLIRNTEMAENADWLIAFWDGKSRGTKDMIEKAEKLKLKVIVIKYLDS